jgi:DNA mismatch repair protein MutS2
VIYPSSFENKIGFDRIRQLVVDNCLCELGRVRASAMSFQFSYEEVCYELDLTEELRKIIIFEENLPQEQYIDSTLCLKKIRIEGAYPELHELNDLRLSLNTIKALTRFLLGQEMKEKYPALCSEAGNVKLFPFVSDRIESILDKNGRIKDNASKGLKDIREELKQKQTSVTRRMLSILKSARQEGIVDADAEITLRNGRPVIPIVAGNKRKLGGLIHDESATGKTIFIEPSEVVELNNEIRELEYAEHREIIRILIEFANEIRPYIDSLLEAYEFLGKMDFLRAKARLAISINGIRPILHKNRSFDWKKAVHPLLFLAHKAEAKDVVPLNINLNEIGRILLISGPNAGGKSVCLKTTGLLQYMLQCGLLVPMSENSEACLFRNIFIDIGDEQSLENDLSTYSGHLLNMKHFVKHADKNTLILIDEFGAGTEPALGGAIAEAILTELNAQGVYGVITTHYGNLKHFASEAQGIINGAMLFDTQKIKPLFTLAIGRPGSSFAIDIARKIGLPESILKVASEKVGEDYVNFEKHLREIIRDKKYWEEKRTRIRKVEKTLDDLYANYNNELEELQKDRKKILLEAKTEAQNLLKDANRQIENTIREIKENNADKAKTKEIREKLEDFKKQFDINIEKTDPFNKKMNELRNAGHRLAKNSSEIKDAKVILKKTVKEADNELSVGDTVRIKELDTIGEVLEINEKSILISIGNMITTIDPLKVELFNGDKKERAKKSQRSYSEGMSERKLNFKPEIDIRGKRADEALSIVREFVDNAAMVSVRELSILHGKGNGILRQLIRDYLKTVNIVKSVRDAHADRGGTGITIVDLDF